MMNVKEQAVLWMKRQEDFEGRERNGGFKPLLVFLKC